MAYVPSDDFLHPVSDHLEHNESAYFNFGVRGGLSGWVRIGYRANEGYAEVSTCVYTPDQQVGFRYKRLEITDRLRHDAGGLCFEVVEPFQRHRVTFAGALARFDDGRALENPREAFAGAPRMDCAMDLDFTAASPVWSGDVDHGAEGFGNFARDHYQQHMTVAGTVQLGDESFDLESGLGWRDHSWGPRQWQQLSWYRWVCASLTPECGVSCTIIGDAEGGHTARGYVHRGTKEPLLEIVDARVRTGYSPDLYPEYSAWQLTAADGSEHVIETSVEFPFALRNTRDGVTTRIIAGRTRPTVDELDGVGISDYVDLIADGVPYGARFA